MALSPAHRQSCACCLRHSSGPFAHQSCRPVAGVCDVEEKCNGTQKDCPLDVLLTTECRAIAGPCDLAESCDGVNPNCPSDKFQPSSHKCGSASGCCDKDDYCTGDKAACNDDVQGASTPCLQTFGPADVNSPTGGTCGTGSPCVQTWKCDGFSKLCPKSATNTTGYTPV